MNDETDPILHGIRSWWRGCRCSECRAAHAQYELGRITDRTLGVDAYSSPDFARVVLKSCASKGNGDRHRIIAERASANQRNYRGDCYYGRNLNSLKRSNLNRGSSTLKRSQLKRAGKPLRARLVSKKATVDGANEREIRDECDQLVRQILKLRDKKCVIFDCRETEGLQVGHYIKREILSLRWDLRNCNAQCPNHNQDHNTNRKPYWDAMTLKYGIGITFQIDEKARINPRLEYVDLLAIRDGLRAELEKVRSEL